ncbi:DUF2309 domain-containing protein [Croceicoccus sp. F390]|uniref:Probable inorganic carbon transporter subunit DabA n=1 Tax=Croceicoccus esteveae TaxID=3075597 RepID=A0ABU2ZHV8_9SPHN|nr:DUF2309 domain-containing protein [Croceicoccus sp. F390]MDT0575970.1 DUF2309 domain-containing protein [Croceicoccus sp. F390]
MNMAVPASRFDTPLTRAEIAGMVALASRIVAPLWPLESAIAVNPLSGFEEYPFEIAVERAAKQFAARRQLPVAQWREMMQAGHIDERALRDAAIEHLGGLDAAFSMLGLDVSRLDLLMARLSAPPVSPVPVSPVHDAPVHDAPAMLARDAALIAKWCAAFFDQGQATSAMPHRQLGLYPAVLALIGHDPDFRALTGAAGQELLLSVPRNPLEAIAEGLCQLEIAPDDQVDWLGCMVSRLPGWAGHIRWRNENADAAISAGNPGTMADLLALWMLLARSGASHTAAAADPPLTARPPAGQPSVTTTQTDLARHFGLLDSQIDALPPYARDQFAAIAGLDEDSMAALFMTAAEQTYANALAPKLRSAAVRPRLASTPDAQLVFCIDVRSEPFRRALEAQGNYETLGYAGFFGLPIAAHPAGGARRKRLLPVLLSPQHDVAEQASAGHEREARAVIDNAASQKHLSRLLDTAKQGGATAFATAEAVGPLAGLLMVARTVAPRWVGGMKQRRQIARQNTLGPCLDRHCIPNEGSGEHTGTGQKGLGNSGLGHSGAEDIDTRGGVFTLEEKIGFATALFRLTGLPADTARLVVLVGHGGTTVNNPYAAALDCGACGGHAGGFNARVLTQMLNDPQVRAGLAADGLPVALHTSFVAAEHDTTTDVVTILDAAEVPDTHRDDLAVLVQDLQQAGDTNRARRAVLLERRPDDLERGAMHWGEVRPEWALSGNAGFIVGPRWLTSEVDLGGRAFLHSYDWTDDADGTALTTILTAPMVVAQWINCQYLFSTIDNDRFGSGNKVTQNVLGGIGVVQGNGGDLRIGLPYQSLFRDDGTPFHVPQRLLTVVLAPFDLVEKVVMSNGVLKRLFGLGWVSLVVIDPVTGEAQRWRRDEQAAGGWNDLARSSAPQEENGQ